MFSPRSVANFKDLFNRNGERNAHNTDQYDYNCGGYALGTFSWYLPCYDINIWGWWKNWTESQVAELTEEAVEIMLRDFSDLRLIMDLRQVRYDEYAIAFRISSDGDFHFCKQDSRKRWTHKAGSSPIRRISQTHIFGSAWNGRYDGPIILFAKKKGLTKPLWHDIIITPRGKEYCYGLFQ